MKYAQKKDFFDFKEESLKKRNDWEYKISTLKETIPEFEFNKIEKMAYAAGPGSYTGEERDHYCESLDQIPKAKSYVVLENDQLQLENMIELKIEEISKNILELVLESDNKALSSNYPNYIKELNYVKSR